MLDLLGLMVLLGRSGDGLVGELFELGLEEGAVLSLLIFQYLKLGNALLFDALMKRRPEIDGLNVESPLD